MSKYGEPWSAARVSENVCDIHEDPKPGCPSLIAEDVDGDHADRIVRCVNALAGIEDPEQFMKDVRMLLDQDHFALFEKLDAARLRLIAALAKVRETN